MSDFLQSSRRGRADFLLGRLLVAHHAFLSKEVVRQLDESRVVVWRLGAVFGTTDFTVVVHDGPMAGQEVPHVHIHVMPRTDGDGGKCAGMAAFPNAPPIGSVEPDFAALGELAKKLQAVP